MDFGFGADEPGGGGELAEGDGSAVEGAGDVLAFLFEELEGSHAGLLGELATDEDDVDIDSGALEDSRPAVDENRGVMVGEECP